jgi:endonuclease/exonuclease/phosphatase family metal-dependent hydrolase
MRACLLFVAGIAVGACLSATPPVADESESSGGQDTTPTSEGTSATGPTTTGPTSETSEPTEGPWGCDTTPVRVATFNTQGIGPTLSDEFVGLVATLYRIDADVLCLQEIEDIDIGALEEAARQAEYTHVVVADASPPIGGEIRNACIGQVPIALESSYTARDLSSDSNANDIGRDILVVRAEASPGCMAGVIDVHLKAGFGESDAFRRTVEVERLVQAVERYRNDHPEDALFVVGDFNTSPSDALLGMDFQAPTSDLPQSFRLGDDIAFPLSFEPFVRMSGLGQTRVEAKWEDSDRDETWSELSRLDYVFFERAALVGSEVYNACQDNGVDDDPPGGWLPKRGDPLSCYASLIASDHLPVFADFVLE